MVFAAGGQHVGLTMGAKVGRLVYDHSEASQTHKSFVASVKDKSFVDGFVCFSGYYLGKPGSKHYPPGNSSGDDCWSYVRDDA